MLFSVVIPTYKRPKLLIECLNCLTVYFDPNFRQEVGFYVEVIVSDDSFDSTLQALLNNRFPWCHYIKGPSRGPAANRNHGARYSSGDWVVFTDDDCLPQPGWLEAYANNAHQIDVMEGNTSPFGFRTRADEECPINQSGGFLWSCNFAVRRDVFVMLNGFNEDFPAAAMEDAELNTRINESGLARKFISNAVVLHPWRQRKGKVYAQAHSLSIGKYVSLHPDQASRFSLASQLKNLVRSLRNNILLAIQTNIYQGILRQIYLDLYSGLLTWIYVKQALANLSVYE